MGLFCLIAVGFMLFPSAEPKTWALPVLAFVLMFMLIRKKGEPRQRAPRKKLKKKKKLALWIAGGVLLGILALVADPLVERFMWNLMTAKLPEVAKIYQEERKRFPNHNVSVWKNWIFTPSGKVVSYSVVLQSNKMPKEEEMLAAGKLACNSGLAPGTAVTVAGRQQFFILPFWIGRSITRQCAGAQGAAQSLPTPSRTDIRCSSADLTASLLPSTRTGYYIYETLALTNKSTHPCTLSGYPEVSLRDSKGNLLGEQATWGQDYGSDEVTLAPNKAAYATIAQSDPANEEPGKCSITSSTMRVYPPGETTLALSVATSRQYCPGFSVSGLHKDM